MQFQVQHSDAETRARSGLITTDHGEIRTPIFMPVGTLATVKGVHQEELRSSIGAQIILGNAYHLYLRPGADIIEDAGGLHAFMNWDRPILTDSGGYQVYSLAENRKIDPEGVTFQSHVDGSPHRFTPESVIDLERRLGADIIMAFDECTPYPCEFSYAESSMKLTHDWLDRCCRRMDETEGLFGYHQALFPIVQGSVFPELRKASAQKIIESDREGYAIGGLSVGEPAEEMYEMTELVTDILPQDRPRYLMGVGTPENLIECVARGVDMFDCVIPTRNARNGMLFTTEGIVNIRNEKWKSDYSPIDPAMNGVSSEHSKAYLRHLILTKEMLGAQIASIHNLTFYLWLMEEIRTNIEGGTFASWSKGMIERVSRRL